MHLKTKTVQAILFTNYSIFFIIILLIVELVFYSFFSNDITDRVSEQQVQLCTSIVNSLDTEVTKMDTVSMNIVYSNLIKDHFLNYLSLSPINTSNNLLIYSERYSNIKSLIDVIMAILGPFQTVSQADIYDFNDNMVGAGIFSGEISANVKEKSWYNNVIKLDGSKYIGIPEYVQLLNSSASLLQNHHFISLSRVYKDSSYNNQGIVEITQDCETLFKFVNNMKSVNNNLQIYVVNSEGFNVYPYNNTNDLKGKYYNNIIKKDSLSPLIIHNVKDSTDGSKQIMTYTTSEISKWTIIVVQSQKVIFASLNKFTKIFLIISALVLLMTLIISFLVSKKVTVPLRKLRHALRDMDIDELSSKNQDSSSIGNNNLNEIEALNITFNKMQQKLGQSLNELLEAKSQELDAKFLAIQSQMNPHFLYNNLANISAMADEGMNKEIVLMCNDISYMLRYISGSSENGVNLRSEIEYTEKYLNCMKIRYEDNLRYKIAIASEMMDIIVPKLIAQPLVENSIKYGLNNQPPWNISITGAVSFNKWFITVIDDGPGFDIEILLKFKDLMGNLNNFSDLPKLQIGGMGLYNICIRLKLLYKEDAIFEITNLKNGGSSVTIGGKINIATKY